MAPAVSLAQEASVQKLWNLGLRRGRAVVECRGATGLTLGHCIRGCPRSSPLCPHSTRGNRYSLNAAKEICPVPISTLINLAVSVRNPIFISGGRCFRMVEEGSYPLF